MPPAADALIAVLASAAFLCLAATVDWFLLRRRKPTWHKARPWSAPWTGPEAVAVVAGMALLPEVTLLVAAGLLVVRVLTGGRAHALGLSLARPQAVVVAATLTWAAVTPAVFGVYWVTKRVNERWLGNAPKNHPLVELFRTEPAGATFTAVVVAPALEEFLFRGVVLSWATREPLAAAALCLPVGLRFAPEVGPWPVGLALAVFGLAALAGRSGHRFGLGRDAAAGVVVTGGLFALLHSGNWPDPVPLVVLGAALGWLALRTRSLLAPVLAHALFNAVSCVVVLAGGA